MVRLCPVRLALVLVTTVVSVVALVPTLYATHDRSAQARGSIQGHLESGRQVPVRFASGRTPHGWPSVRGGETVRAWAPSVRTEVVKLGTQDAPGGAGPEGAALDAVAIQAPQLSASRESQRRPHPVAGLAPGGSTNRGPPLPLRH